jgi:hypothetical protein
MARVRIAWQEGVSCTPVSSGSGWTPSVDACAEDCMARGTIAKRRNSPPRAITISRAFTLTFLVLSKRTQFTLQLVLNSWIHCEAGVFLVYHMWALAI